MKVPQRDKATSIIFSFISPQMKYSIMVHYSLTLSLNRKEIKYLTLLLQNPPISIMCKTKEVISRMFTRHVDTNGFFAIVFVKLYAP